VLTGHATRVNSCTFSPDGATLVTASHGTVRLWHIASGTFRRCLTGHNGNVFGCAFSPDGALLATGASDGARLWHVATGSARIATTGRHGCGRFPAAPHAVVTTHTGWVRSCAFSPDGAVLATASADRTIRLWQLPDGTAQAVLTGHTSHMIRCAFSPARRISNRDIPLQQRVAAIYRNIVRQKHVNDSLLWLTVTPFAKRGDVHGDSRLPR
jgi:WD40 repeat protein